MADLGDAFKKASKAFMEAMGPGQYSVRGKKIVCPNCEGDIFAEGTAQLNTAGMTFLNLDWANKSATTLACKECGRILWFMIRPDRL
jgi:uncharacterized protein